MWKYVNCVQTQILCTRLHFQLIACRSFGNSMSKLSKLKGTTTNATRSSSKLQEKRSKIEIPSTDLLIASSDITPNIKEQGESQSALIEDKNTVIVRHLTEISSKLISCQDEASQTKVWDELKRRLRDDKSIKVVISSINFDSYLINSIIQTNYQNEAVLCAFYDRLKAKRIDQNPYLQAHCCSLLLHLNQSKFEPEIKRLIESLLQNRRLLTHTSRYDCFTAYASRSRACFEHFWNCLREQDRVSMQPIANKLLQSAFAFDLIPQAFQFLSSWPKVLFHVETIDAMLHSSLSNDLSLSCKMNILKVLQERRILLRNRHKKLICDLLRSMNYTLTYCEIINNQCESCHTQLQTITSSELELLAGNILKLLQSQPPLEKSPQKFNEEIKLFLKFMQDSMKDPFDLVIDGLNIAHLCSSNRLVKFENKVGFAYMKSAKLLEASLIKQLKTVLSDSRWNRVLIIGRNHMNRWTQLFRFVDQKSSHVQMYLVPDRAPDDLFTLYASMCSERSFVLTGDVLRQHQFGLGPEVHSLFDKWVACRVCKPMRDFNPGCDKVLNIAKRAIHIPIDYAIDEHDCNVRWMCARPAHSVSVTKSLEPSLHS